MEPNILGGARTPKPDDKVVLFHIPEGEQVGHTSAAYQAAPADPATLIGGGLRGWRVQPQRDQSPACRGRVLGSSHSEHLASLDGAPSFVNRTAGRLDVAEKKFEPLKSDEKEAIATFMATGSPVRRRSVAGRSEAPRKIYKALGIDAKRCLATSTRWPLVRRRSQRTSRPQKAAGCA